MRQGAASGLVPRQGPDPIPQQTRRQALFGILLFAWSIGQGLAQPTGDSRRSGLLDMRPATQAMQRDDSANPGMLAVLQGGQLWGQPQGQAGRSCAGCHGEPSSMAGVATRYPAFDARLGRPITLEQRIQACRSDRQQGPLLAAESPDLLALTTLVAHQSRGRPIAPPEDPRLQPFRERGQQRYEQRIGQLNFSCRDCHDTMAGGRLGASIIPQGHPTAYPIYRLEWQAMGSLQRRLRNCMTGVRAEPFNYSAIELIELELHLAWRARQMLLETPGVRP